MSQAGVREDRIIVAFERVAPSRTLLLVVGLCCVGLGVVAIWLPLSLFGALVWVVGALLLGTGVIKLLLLRKHPWRGMVAELNTRVVEWLAFHLGGPAGKQLSLTIRRIGSTVTMWLMRPSQRSAPG